MNDFLVSKQHHALAAGSEVQYSSTAQHINGGNHALGLTFVPAWDKEVVSGAKRMNSTPPFVVLSGQTEPSQSV